MSYRYIEQGYPQLTMVLMEKGNSYGLATREIKIGVLRIVFIHTWCIFYFDKPWIFSLAMIVQIEYDDDESDKYDEEPGNCLEMEEGVHLVTRTATAAAPSDLSGQTFLG